MMGGLGKNFVRGVLKTGGVHKRGISFACGVAINGILHSKYFASCVTSSVGECSLVLAPPLF